MPAVAAEQALEVLESIHPNHALSDTLKLVEKMGFVADQKRRKGEIYVSYAGKPGYVINLRRKDTGHGLLAYLKRTLHQVHGAAPAEVEETEPETGEKEDNVRVYNANTLQGEILKVLIQIKSGTVASIQSFFPDYTQKRIRDSLYHLKYAEVVRQNGMVFNYVEGSARVEGGDLAEESEELPETTAPAEEEEEVEEVVEEKRVEFTPTEKILAFLKIHPKTNLNILVGTIKEVPRSQIQGALNTLKRERLVDFDGYVVTALEPPVPEEKTVVEPVKEEKPPVEEPPKKVAEPAVGAETSKETPASMEELVAKLQKSLRLTSDSLQIAMMGLEDISRLLPMVPAAAMREAEGTEEIKTVMELLSEIVSKRGAK